MNNFITLNNLNQYQNQSLKIGILGGSFDPPHLGHLHLARSAFARLNLDEIWFSLSPQNPTKPAHKYPYKSRRAMLNRLLQSDSKFKVLEIELELGLNTTSKLFEYLNTRLKNIRFYFLMGLDLVTQIEKWEGFEELEAMVELVFFSRGGYKHTNKIHDLLVRYQNIKFIKIDEINISSTQIKSAEQRSINESKI